MSLSTYVQMKVFIKISWTVVLIGLFLGRKLRGTFMPQNRECQIPFYAKEIENHNEKNVTFIH